METIEPEERGILLKAVLSDPESDTPRQAYADLLDREGDHARAEFIRVQLELGRESDCGACGGKRWYHVDDGQMYSEDCIYCSGELRAREKKLLDENELDWLPACMTRLVGNAIASHVIRDRTINPAIDDSPWSPFQPPYRWGRGFIDKLRCQWYAFLDLEQDLIWHPGQHARDEHEESFRPFNVGAHPVSFVEVTDTVLSVGYGASLALRTVQYPIGDGRWADFERLLCEACGSNRRDVRAGRRDTYRPCRECGGRESDLWKSATWPATTFRIPKLRPAGGLA